MIGTIQIQVFRVSRYGWRRLRAPPIWARHMFRAIDCPTPFKSCPRVRCSVSYGARKSLKFSGGRFTYRSAWAGRGRHAGGQCAAGHWRGQYGTPGGIRSVLRLRVEIFIRPRRPEITTQSQGSRNFTAAHVHTRTHAHLSCQPAGGRSRTARRSVPAYSHMDNEFEGTRVPRRNQHGAHGPPAYQPPMYGYAIVIPILFSLRATHCRRIHTGPRRSRIVYPAS